VTNGRADDDGDDVLGRAMPEPLDDESYRAMITSHEEHLAQQRLSSIDAARRRAGPAGAAMAAAMLAVAEIYEGPRKDDKPVTVEASSDPDDIDRDGIDLSVGDVDVSAGALPRAAPVVGGRRDRPPQV
jgi:hypothetical protein